MSGVLSQPSSQRCTTYSASLMRHSARILCGLVPIVLRPHATRWRDSFASFLLTSRPRPGVFWFALFLAHGTSSITRLLWRARGLRSCIGILRGLASHIYNLAVCSVDIENVHNSCNKRRAVMSLLLSFSFSRQEGEAGDADTQRYQYLFVLSTPTKMFCAIRIAIKSYSKSSATAIDTSSF